LIYDHPGQFYAPLFYRFVIIIGTLSIIGLILNLAGVILLFRYRMSFSARTGGSEVRFTGQTNPQIVKGARRYDVLGCIGLVLIVVGALSQVGATLLMIF
jgi:hypothetical protein